MHIQGLQTWIKVDLCWLWCLTYSYSWIAKLESSYEIIIIHRLYQKAMLAYVNKKTGRQKTNPNLHKGIVEINKIYINPNAKVIRRSSSYIEKLWIRGDRINN